MATVEVFTVGGGEYIVNVFNAVAAWTGQGGYKSLIQVVMVMGFTWACITIAFNNDWRAWINWFLQATLIYMCLMVPRLDIHVTDRVNPSLAPADVANVPLGLALMASFTSQVGDYLTTASEVVFGLPNDLNYSTNGMVYGARLMQATQSIQFNNPEFAANLDDHMRNCVFYDVLLGHKSMDTLAKAPDLWAVIGPGSPARAQKFLTKNPDGTVTSAIVTCQIAYNTMSSQLTATGGAVDQVADPLARSLYPKLLPTVAKAKLLADLGGSYSYLTGVSASAAAVLKQNLLMNAVTQAMHTMTATGGGTSIDVYAQTRAEIQTRNTYNAIGQTAMKWVPLLHIVLTVMFYALFPVLFPVFLIPGTGVATLKGYVTGFFYLAAWGPLFVILHMILMFKGAGDMTAVAGGTGATLFSTAGIAGISDDLSALAGYLIASVPFIAGGVAKGAMAISSNATSFLAPSQNAAEVAAGEASTGNISAGNTTLDNFSYNSKQGNVWSSMGSYASGASVFNARQDDGTVTSSYSGSTVVDASGAISRLPVSPQLTEELQSSFTRSATVSKARSETLSNSASTSYSNANVQSADLRRTLSNGQTLDQSYGTDDRKTITSGLTAQRQLAEKLHAETGMGLAEAEGHVSELTATGQFNLGLGSPLKGVVGSSIGIAGSLGGSKKSSRSNDARATYNVSKANDILTSYANSDGFNAQRDNFNRAVRNTSNSSVVSQANSASSSYTRAAAASQEARTAYDQSQRYEEAASLRDSHGVSVAENASQRFLNFVLKEQRGLAAMGIQTEWNPTQGQATSPEQLSEQRFYMQEFVKAENERIAGGVESKLVAPTPAGIARPSKNTQARLSSAGAEDRAALEARGLPVGSMSTGTAELDASRARIDADYSSGGGRIAHHLNVGSPDLAKVAPALSKDPKQTLGRLGPHGLATRVSDSIDDIVNKITKR